MSFRACVVIPIYNHKDTIAATVATIVALDLPCFVVDDGSDEATQRLLAQLSGQYAAVMVTRLPRNSGKGVAVIAGLRQALAAGFTHGLQIDADGQHDCGDIPQFLRCAEHNPLAVICGQPVYDASVPRGRLYGRYITHFWVGVETLTLRPLDALCGFRVYPLAATIAVADTSTLGQRMDFDPEVLVRLIWAGVPALGLRTRVTYPAQGLSHFDYLRDNLRISKMHTRLTCGMLLRLPQLLLQKWRAAEGASDTRHWSRIAERGSMLGLYVLLWAFRHGGRAFCTLLLYPVLLYFVIVNRSARQASLDFWHRLQAASPSSTQQPGLVTTFRHFFSFGVAALDRVASWAGMIGRDDIDFDRRDDLLHIARSGRGALLLGSHLGNLELCRALSDGIDGLRMTALVFTQHALKFNALLEQVNPRAANNLIQVSELSPDVAIMLKRRVDAGELIVIVGDRTPLGGRNRISHAQFLGQRAAFPQGPYIIASLLECPVYLLFCLKQHGRYRVYLEDFVDRIELPRKQRDAELSRLVQLYAARLEHYCRQQPMQWFNFYDFWQAGPAPLPQMASQHHV